MEKFSRFDDQRSSVNPFTQQPWRPGFARLLCGSLLGAIKLPFIGLCWLGIVIASVVAPLVRPCHMPTDRLLLTWRFAAVTRG